MVSAEVGSYLVEMLILKEKTGEITAKKLSDKLHVSCAAVTQMVRKLDEEDLVRYESYGEIRLTSRGRAIARKILSKRRLMRSFLLMAGIKRGSQLEADYLSTYMSDRVYDAFDDFILESAKSRHDVFPISRAEPEIKLAVVAITARANTRKKLQNMGIAPGTDIIVKDVKRGNITVSVDSSKLEISKKDAKNILVVFL